MQTEAQYIASAANNDESITRIDTIITNLIIQSATASANPNTDISEYALDDGQTKIRTLYLNPDAIAKAILHWQRAKFQLINQRNGRVTRLRPFDRLKPYC